MSNLIEKQTGNAIRNMIERIKQLNNQFTETRGSQEPVISCIWQICYANIIVRLWNWGFGDNYCAEKKIIQNLQTNSFRTKYA